MKILKKIQNRLKQNCFTIKSLFFVLAFGMTPILISAQTESGFGIKAGVNYNANGDYFDALATNAENPERNIGYHIGVFGKLGNEVYVKPELIFTSTKSDYSSNVFDMKKIDAPILVGVKVLGPLSVFGGPAFQYILDSKFEGISVNDIDKDLSMGLNFGIGLNLKKVGLDIRYERGFTENGASFLNNNNIDTDRIHTRPDQLIVSLSIML